MKVVTKYFDGQLITMRTEGFWSQTKIFLYLPDARENKGNISIPHPRIKLYTCILLKNNYFRNDQGTIFKKQKTLSRQGEEKNVLRKNKKKQGGRTLSTE